MDRRRLRQLAAVACAWRAGAGLAAALAVGPAIATANASGIPLWCPSASAAALTLAALLVWGRGSSRQLLAVVWLAGAGAFASAPLAAAGWWAPPSHVLLIPALAVLGRRLRASWLSGQRWPRAVALWLTAPAAVVLVLVLVPAPPWYYQTLALAAYPSICLPPLILAGLLRRRAKRSEVLSHA